MSRLRAIAGSAAKGYVAWSALVVTAVTLSLVRDFARQAAARRGWRWVR